ncbi:TMEM175 family protein [Streptomyces sp. JNUCC 63]
MPADGDSPRGRRSLDTDRLAAFSDGVFSISATLLVLGLAVRPPGTPLEQVLHAWPDYLAYLVSFLTVGSAWLVHTVMTSRLDRSDLNLLRLNLLILLVVAFLPFPTRLVTDALHTGKGEGVAVTIYGLALLAIRLLGAALDAYARRKHLYPPQAESREAPSTQRRLLPVVIGYVVAILIGLFLPAVTVAMYFGLAVYLIVPFRGVAHLLFRRS